MKSIHIIKIQQKNISLLKNQIQNVKIRFQKNQFKFIIAKTNVVKNFLNDQSEIIARLKEMRVYHKDHVKKFTQKMIKLRLNKKTLEKEIQDFVNRKKTVVNEIQNFDDDESMLRKRRDITSFFRN